MVFLRNEKLRPPIVMYFKTLSNLKVKFSAIGQGSLGIYSNEASLNERKKLKLNAFAVGLYYGMNEIATGCTGGIIALGMKVLEAE